MKRVVVLIVSTMLSACGGGGSQKAAAAVVVGLPPANPQAVTLMVQGVQAAKEPNGRERAIGLLREAINQDKNLWEARYDLGIVLASGGDLAGAEEQLRAANKLAPEAVDVVIGLAEVQRRRGENREAADALGDYLQTHVQAVEARTLYVGALRNSGQIDKAIAQARELLVRKPGDASALAELALCHLSKGEKDTASLLAKQALDSNPKSAVAERATGLIALANGDDALAFQSFLKATQEDPRDTTARLNMGGVLLRAGAYSKAEEQYRAILVVSPEDADAAVGLAAALRGEADTAHPAKYEEARSLLEKVLVADPHNVSALFNLAVLYTDFLKKPEESRQYFRRFLSDARSDHPTRPEAERYLSLMKAAAPPPPVAPPPPKGPAKPGAK
ncbi:MAG: tetratricopeptide repeat protein [Polyangiaceae bacterium]